ncbi:NADPH-dependent oxidoreductase [Candidatus Saccharibacteria bacterium]|nr:NADPH-dependent oxidoreductase [Candidatus Saccharibacteria bacterium]
MTKVLILTGSARPNSVSTQVAKLVETELQKREGVTPDVVEVAELNLPFYNATISPSAEDYVATDENVKAWSDMVTGADAVVWVMPEYNHSISAIQKNAIDWLYKEWTNKPLAIVAYGWYEGANVLESVKWPLKVLKSDVRATAGLGFMKQLEVDGKAKDQAAVDQILSTTVDALLAEKQEVVVSEEVDRVAA